MEEMIITKTKSITVLQKLFIAILGEGVELGEGGRPVKRFFIEEGRFQSSSAQL